MSQCSVLVRITGRVQGVSYRAWTEHAAAELGLRGWVRNRRDGSVEALFHGPPDKVADMVARCRSGPPAARVADVAASECDPAGEIPARFEFRPTSD